MIHLNTYGWNNGLDQLKQKSAYKTLSHGTGNNRASHLL